MIILIALVIAILAWLLRREGVAQRHLLALKVRYADVGATYEQPSLVSARYGLSGRPDYLVRVDCGVVPVELKSGKSPRSGRPYDGHLFQLVAYCLLVEDVCQAFVPYGVIEYEDRSIRVEYTSALRKSLLGLLEQIRTAKRGGEFHIDHNRPGKCRSCGFHETCGESLA
jgi:CRISPR-associated exonuclease Cas4